MDYSGVTDVANCSSNNAALVPDGVAICDEPAAGTMAYVAPELLLGLRQTGPWIDIWSTGCVLVEMVTRRILFQTDSVTQQVCDNRTTVKLSWNRGCGGLHLHLVVCGIRQERVMGSKLDRPL